MLVAPAGSSVSPMTVKRIKPNILSSDFASSRTFYHRSHLGATTDNWYGLY